MNTLLLSLFWYNAQTLLIPPEISKLIQQDIERFTWKRSHTTIDVNDTPNAASPHDYRRWLRHEIAMLSRREGGDAEADWASASHH